MKGLNTKNWTCVDPKTGLATKLWKGSSTGETCGIYKITSPYWDFYIGQSVNIEKRLGDHKYRSANTKASGLYESIRKYGWNAHVVEVLYQCKPDELDYWEQYFIKVYDSFDTSHGLNMTSGGGGLKVYSDAVKKKIGDANRGERHYLYGKKQSAETRLKKSIAHKKLVRSDEQMAAFRKGADMLAERRRKPVLAVKDCTIQEFRKIIIAARELHISDHVIRRNINKGVSFRGYLFYYLNENN